MPLTISDADLYRLTQFIQRDYGIDLTRKRQLIASRLSASVQALGYASFTPFIDHLLQEKHQDDLELVLNKLTTNYTFFHREKEHFSFFKDTILPELVARHQKDKVLSIWSAGCSSGEEPYTISMYLLDYLGSQAPLWDTRVLATDISQRALASARAGVYELPDNLPLGWRQKYFVQEPGGESFRVAPKIQRNVIFQTFNLMDPIRFKLRFDVIFCRNVMIYFDQSTKDALVQRFFGASSRGGYLLIGHSETIGRNSGYRFIAPATFQKP